MEKQLARIAQKIKTWRTDAGLSLQQLGERCHVSPSTIHKIENNASVPTIAVVLKLAEGLGRSPGELVEDGPRPVEASLTREAERSQVTTAGGTRIDWVAQGLADPELDVWRVAHPVGFDSETDHVPDIGAEVAMIVEEGELIASIGDREFKLLRGDCLHFKASSPYRWRNIGSETARVLLVGKSASSSHQRGLATSRLNRAPTTTTTSALGETKLTADCQEAQSV